LIEEIVVEGIWSHKRRAKRGRRRRRHEKNEKGNIK
jgi:hypothetical protein